MKTPDVGFLFDLDGVIIDSESEYSRIWRQINLEFPTGVENLENVIKGYTLTKILNEYYGEKSIQERVCNQLHMLENQMHYEYLPNAREFLETLKARGISCALVTSSDDEKMEHLYDEIPEIPDFFDFIVTGNLVKTSKPSPEGYLLGASKIGKKIRNCVIFEDSLQGVMAGKNADALVVGMVGTLSQDILEPFSDLLVSNFGEVNIEGLIQILEER